MSRTPSSKTSTQQVAHIANVCSWLRTRWARHSALEPKSPCTSRVVIPIGGVDTCLSEHLLGGVVGLQANPLETTLSEFFWGESAHGEQE